MSIHAKRTLFLVFVVPLILLATLTTWMSLVEAAPTEVCSVPGDYSTIQAAIDDPDCLDVSIGTGTFYETVSITRSITIHGQGPDATAIDGMAGDSVFVIDGRTTPAMSVTITSLQITKGSAPNGGGILNIQAALTLTDSHVTGNWASGWGGGILSQDGELNIENSHINHNEADTGGGLYIENGTATIERSSIGHNDAGFHGGGLFNGDGNVTLEEVSVTFNTTYVDGGGIFNGGTMTINNSSINKNESTNYSGGGVRNEASLLYLNNTTISSNKAALGAAGIDNWDATMRLNSSTIANNVGTGYVGGIGSQNSNVRIQNSIVSENTPNDCEGPNHSNGYNIVGDTSNCDYQPSIGDFIGTSPNLGPLEGEPSYHPLLPGLGINAGNPDGCTNQEGEILTTDQRGMLRRGRCDIGAYEFQGELHQAFLPVCYDTYCPDFHDDFNDPTSGWPIGEDAYNRYGYLNGEYQILTKVDGFFFIFAAPSCERENYVVEVDARWVGEPGSGYGLIFSIFGAYEQYYLFDINTDYQMFRLLYRSPSGWETLISPTTSNAINSGNQSNHLQVTRNGSQITLVVNGTNLRVLNDNRIRGLTGAGIVSSPYNEFPDTDARFDNFSVVHLPSTNGITLETNDRVDSNVRVPYRYGIKPLSSHLSWE